MVSDLSSRLRNLRDNDAKRSSSFCSLMCNVQNEAGEQRELIERRKEKGVTHERIIHEEEVFKLAWTTAVVTAGGAFWLILGERTLERVLLAGAGFLFTLLLALFVLSKDREIRDATEEQR
jgi:hypothetical protein